VAEELAMLDVLSGGRLDVGVGRGMGTQYFDVFGAVPETAQEKMEEQIALLQTAWTQPEFSWDGAFYQCPQPITVLPRPVQQPLPLWIPSGTSPGHTKWIGRTGANLMTLPWRLPKLEMNVPLIDAYHEGLNEAGYSEAGRQVMTYFSVYVG